MAKKQHVLIIICIAGIVKGQVNGLTNDIFGESSSSGGKSSDPADLEKSRKEEKKK